MEMNKETEIRAAIYIPDELSINIYTHLPPAIEEIQALAQSEGFSFGEDSEGQYYELFRLGGRNSKDVAWLVEQIFRRHGVTELLIKICGEWISHTVATLENRDLLPLISPTKYNAVIHVLRDVPVVRVFSLRPMDSDVSLCLLEMAQRAMCQAFPYYKNLESKIVMGWTFELSPWHDIDEMAKDLQAMLLHEHGFSNTLIHERSA